MIISCEYCIWIQDREDANSDLEEEEQNNHEMKDRKANKFKIIMIDYEIVLGVKLV